MKKEAAHWWRLYPRSGCPYDQLQIHPDPHQVPVFQPGEMVRLKGKPDKARLVLSVEWHSYCHDFVYIVETSSMSPSGRPYWFAVQLISEAQWQREQLSTSK